MSPNAITLSIVTALCLIFSVEAESEEQNPSIRDTREANTDKLPFLIFVPDESTDSLERSISILQDPKSSEKRSVTSVEIVRSIELSLNGTGNPRSNSGVQSPDSTDLLFSDVDRKDRTRENSEKSTRNRSVRYRRIKSNLNTSLPINPPVQNGSENIYSHNISADSLDFNGRLLLGNILIRKAKDDFENDKYSFFSEPKADGNKVHATYIDHNSTVPMNKSRINVKFPPKTFPLKSQLLQQTQRNKTTNANAQTPSKIETRKALYRSRIGKQTNKLAQKIKINSTQTSSAQQIQQQAKGQSITHWDFGKKTTSGEEELTRPVYDTTTSINPTINEMPSNLPNLIHPTRSTLQPKAATTPKPITENVIKRPIGQQVVIQQAVPIYNHINTAQGVAGVPTVNPAKNPRTYQIFHSHNGNIVGQDLGMPLLQQNAGQYLQYLGGNVIQQSFGQNLVKHNLGANVQKNVEHSLKQNIAKNPFQQRVQNFVSQNHFIHGFGQTVVRPELATNTIRQDLGPQVFPYPEYNNDNIRGGSVNIKTRNQQQSEQQQNWQPVYFVPHVALTQQQLPGALIALQTVNSRTGPQTIPVLLQQQNSRSTDLAGPGLFPADVIPNPPTSIPAHNGFIYEGVLVAYPQDVQGQSSDFVPIIIS